MLSPCLEELSLCRDPLCHTGPEPPVSTAHQPSHETLSRDPPYHPPNQDSTQASPRRPKERTPWGAGGGGGSGGEGERDPGDRTAEAGGRASHAELPSLSRMLTRPALLNCWGQNQSDRWGRCDRGHQQLQPDSPTVYTANLPGPASAPGPVAEPQSPSFMWGAMPDTPSRAPHS